MKMYRVVSGKYVGRVGHGEINEEYGTIMFYPVEGEYPYRTCLKLSGVEEI